MERFSERPFRAGATTPSSASFRALRPAGAWAGIPARSEDVPRRQGPGFFWRTGGTLDFAFEKPAIERDRVAVMAGGAGKGLADSPGRIAADRGRTQRLS